MPIEPIGEGGWVATGPGITVVRFKYTMHAIKLRSQGLHVTSPKKFPTVRQFCEQWHVVPRVRTWAELYEVFLRREALWRMEYDADEKFLSILTHGKELKE